jgi:hypothetical protein
MPNAKGEVREMATADGGVLRIVGRRASVLAKEHGRRLWTHVDLTGLPLADLILSFAEQNAEDVAAGTIIRRLRDPLVLVEWMKISRLQDLTADIYRGFLRWLVAARLDDGGQRFGPSTIANVAGQVLALYEHGLNEEHATWTEHALDTMYVCRSRELRGTAGRRHLRSIERAVHVEQFEQLLHALRLELDQCRRRLAAASTDDLANLGVGPLDPEPVRRVRTLRRCAARPSFGRTE